MDVQRHLTRNFLAHLCHGLLGQTGFRLLNAPTFLPAYIAMLSGGSNLAVGLLLSLQSVGMTLTPLLGANLIEHRRRVLPLGFAIGLAMRLSVLLIALAGLLLPPRGALYAIGAGLLLFGMCSGMQGVVFNYLMSKVIPVSKRGRLTGLRNFLAGGTAAVVAWVGGQYLVGATPTTAGYSHTFALAFVLTMLGLMALLAMREPEPPAVRERQALQQRVREIPELLRADPLFTRFILARALATTGRMALPFYVLHAGENIGFNGANLALMTVAFTLSGTASNLIWGFIADRAGFRVVMLAAISSWSAATVGLLLGDTLAVTAGSFIGIGAGVQGFQNASANLTLEFGDRTDLPTRIAIANTGSELAGSVGPVIGGLLASAMGYTAVFVTSLTFLFAGGVLITWLVPEPRTHRTPKRT